MDNLKRAQETLLADQFNYGEWGKCESPTAARDLEISRLKPNCFSSSEAAFSLVATGAAGNEAIATYLDWVQKTRSPDGWWHSAAGSKAPSQNAPAWVRNVRHTAIGIDVRILAKQFDGDDLRNIGPLIALQLSNGAFPQFSGGAADLWSTLYVLNLLITVTHNDEACRISRPSNVVPRSWEAELRTKIEKSRAWLTDQVKDGNHWELPDTDAGWVTQAIAVEIGAHLARTRPDVCPAIGQFLLDLTDQNNPKTLWALLCVWIGLSASQQLELKSRLAKFVYSDQSDTLSMACSCRVVACDCDPLFVQYYFDAAHGHSAALPRWGGWDRTEYGKWNVLRANASPAGNAMAHGAVSTKADLWLTVSGLLNVYKEGIEKSGDWRILWTDSHSHTDEAGIQRHFMSVARALAKSWGIAAIREPDTGTGPVDSEFSNGYVARIHVEFKRMDHTRIQHGLMSQLPSYMQSDGVDSGIFVCVGFDDDSEDRYSRLVLPARDAARSANSNIWLETIYIDARRRSSASN
ncbi:hypothetical protein J4G43_052920 (plasmid) [Bradyrhizobium barranii subsp. barranii]|uniref:Uncharacterized protein n=1 Tax=Bradyrhizobium barranii subsp. barranii TaxID=2823807 RepID=A0A939MGG1_9BRAD|nr:hypothetical protein [Bradyrhizobium barranii]UEM17929.1 hypothetical protein J4G43_052920 [Bradyrhizobium barranii subsp. barranii]